jgi:hypothetical protein
VVWCVVRGDVRWCVVTRGGVCAYVRLCEEKESGGVLTLVSGSVQPPQTVVWVRIQVWVEVRPFWKEMQHRSSLVVVLVLPMAWEERWACLVA